jgi:RNA polymerase sigma factor (sigma-70 family)
MLTTEIDPLMHTDLVDKVIRVMGVRVSDRRDLEQNGFLGLKAAANRYSAILGRFSSYAWPWIRKYIISGIRQEKLIKPPTNKPKIKEEYQDALDFGIICGVDNIEGIDSCEQDYEQREIISIIYKTMQAIPHAKQRRIIIEHHIQGRSLSNIAKEMGTSRQNIHVHLKRAERVLRLALVKYMD